MGSKTGPGGQKSDLDPNLSLSLSFYFSPICLSISAISFRVKIFESLQDVISF